MKIIYFALLLFISSFCLGQNQEFTIHSNGLIYDSITMNKLSYIVDSLNVSFGKCEMNTVYKSKSQNIGHIIRLENGLKKRAMKDMDNAISFKDFIKKYPNATVKKDELIIKNYYTNYKKEQLIEFSQVNVINKRYNYSVEKPVNWEQNGKDYSKTWVYEESHNSITAIYFPSNFTSTTLKEKYARMVGYADCLIDTTVSKFKEDAKRGWVALPENWRDLNIIEKDSILDTYRSTKVIGSCSQDESPRRQALEMALLSAETVNWEIFLKSHLDIMNDRFQSVAYSNAMEGYRETYINELEMLNIEVFNLILGISLRVENPAENHYHSSIYRVGRALSETKNKEEIEKILLKMIADNELDYYNRVLTYYLFLNYNANLKNEESRNENIEKLNKAVESLPEFLKNKIKSKDD